MVDELQLSNRYGASFKFRSNTQMIINSRSIPVGFDYSPFAFQPEQQNSNFYKDSNTGMLKVSGNTIDFFYYPKTEEEDEYDHDQERNSWYTCR